MFIIDSDNCLDNLKPQSVAKFQIVPIVSVSSLQWKPSQPALSETFEFSIFFENFRIYFRVTGALKRLQNVSEMNSEHHFGAINVRKPLKSTF